MNSNAFNPITSFSDQLKKSFMQEAPKPNPVDILIEGLEGITEMPSQGEDAEKMQDAAKEILEEYYQALSK